MQKGATKDESPLGFDIDHFMGEVDEPPLAPKADGVPSNGEPSVTYQPLYYKYEVDWSFNPTTFKPQSDIYLSAIHKLHQSFNGHLPSWTDYLWSFLQDKQNFPKAFQRFLQAIIAGAGVEDTSEAEDFIKSFDQSFIDSLPSTKEGLFTEIGKQAHNWFLKQYQLAGSNIEPAQIEYMLSHMVTMRVQEQMGVIPHGHFLPTYIDYALYHLNEGWAINALNQSGFDLFITKPEAYLAHYQYDEVFFGDSMAYDFVVYGGYFGPNWVSSCAGFVNGVNQIETMLPGTSYRQTHALDEIPDACGASIRRFRKREGTSGYDKFASDFSQLEHYQAPFEKYLELLEAFKGSLLPNSKKAGQELLWAQNLYQQKQSQQKSLELQKDNRSPSPLLSEEDEQAVVQELAQLSLSSPTKSPPAPAKATGVPAAQPKSSKARSKQHPRKQWQVKKSQATSPKVPKAKVSATARPNSAKPNETEFPPLSLEGQKRPKKGRSYRDPKNKQ